MRSPTIAAALLGALTITASLSVRADAAPDTSARTASRPHVALPPAHVLAPSMVPHSAALPNLLEAVRRNQHPFAAWHPSYLGRSTSSIIDHYAYSCVLYADACQIYELGGALVNTIGGLTYPQGVATDTKHRIYVSNSYAEETLIYAPEGSSLVSTLADSGYLPAFTAWSKKLTAVSEFYSYNGSSYGHGRLALYKSTANGSKPSYFLTDPEAYEGESVAFDSQGDCFWAFNTNYDAGPGYIDEFPKCKAGSRRVRLPIATTFAGALAFDSSGDLWYSDQQAGTINVCSSAGSGCFVEASGFGDPVAMTWDGATFMILMDASAGMYELNILGDPIGFVSISPSAIPVGAAIDVDQETE